MRIEPQERVERTWRKAGAWRVHQHRVPVFSLAPVVFLQGCELVQVKTGVARLIDAMVKARALGIGACQCHGPGVLLQPKQAAAPLAQEKSGGADPAVEVDYNL